MRAGDNAQIALLVVHVLPNLLLLLARRLHSPLKAQLHATRNTRAGVRVVPPPRPKLAPGDKLKSRTDVQPVRLAISARLMLKLLVALATTAPQDGTFA